MGRLLAEQAHGVAELVAVYPYGTALPDQAKNNAVGGAWVEEQKRRDDLTDSNRNRGVAAFMNRDAEWLLWLDDDVVPPRGFLTRLLSLRRDFVAGLYFLGAHPHNPIAYIKEPDGSGLYKAFYKYPTGALVQVDSVGMGCTLIHRSVYEKILAGCEVWQRSSGSLMAVPKDRIYQAEGGHLVGGLYIHPDGNADYLQPMQRPADDDNRPFPFYAMENSRTEDHHFCELAALFGIKPTIDTEIVCEHIKLKSVSRQDYLESLNASKETY
jgi:hypothetical protein